MTPAVTEETGPKPRQLYSLSKLIRGSGSRVVHLCLMTMIGLLLTPMIVHSLGPEQYGIWALAYGFVGYFSLPGSRNVCFGVYAYVLRVNRGGS